MPEKAEPFSSRVLRERLREFPAAKRYMVGFSGGADSTALLVALARQRNHLGADIEAIHFDHGLHQDSGRWSKHCESLCRQLDIAFTSVPLGLSPDLPDLENRARQLRYGWVEDHIDRDTVYLTAHHADDRAETFLINALRGSGLDGMAGIPVVRALGKGHVARPLLDDSRAALLAYLELKGIDWIDDPSNRESGPDRNFLRNEVIPLLESRWPAARQTLARTSAHLRGAREVLRDLLTHHTDLAAFDDFRLPTAVFHAVDHATASLLLREWLRRHDAPPVPRKRLGEFMSQLAAASPESRCELSWEGWAVRLYRDELRLLVPGDMPRCPQLSWSAGNRLELGPGLGHLGFDGDTGPPDFEWTVAPRRPGSRIRLHRDGPARLLKKVLAEQPIPPWQRESIPILYKDDAAIAIGDWLIAPQFGEWLSAAGLEFSWRPDLPELRDTRRLCHDNARSGRTA